MKPNYFLRQVCNLVRARISLFFLKKSKNGVILYGNNFFNSGAPKIYLQIKDALLNAAIDVACISRDYGPLVKKASKGASFYLFNYRGQSVFKRLYKKGYKKLLLNVVSTFQYIENYKEIGFSIISLLHESAILMSNPFYAKMIHDAANYSDRFFVPSESTRQQYITAGLPPEKCEIMYFNSDVTMPILPNPIPLKDPYFCSISGCDPEHKGFSQFVTIARQVPSANFVWVGFAVQLDDPSLPPNISIYPPRFSPAEIHSIISHSLGLISCSKSETFGLTLYEAICLSVPVVANKTMGGLASWLKADEQILLAESRDDIEGYVRLISLLQNDPSFRQKIISGGASFATDYQSHDAIQDVVSSWVGWAQ